MHYNTIMKIIGNNLSPLCFLPSGKLVCYRQGEVLVFENGQLIKTISTFHNRKEKFLSRSRYIYRLLRMGVRAAWAIDDQNILLSVGNTII